jgi:hypothetical protein
MSIRYIDDQDLYASGAYVGLALPGEAGSWQRECKVNQHAMYITPGFCSQNELCCIVLLEYKFYSHILHCYRDTNSGVEQM